MDSDSPAAAPPRGQFHYELRIGVTGHRDIADATAVQYAVHQCLDSLEGILQPQLRTPLNWTVVSPIARGADRIVAEAVLKRIPSTLEVLSPFKLDEYRHDFRESEDREEFEQFLTRAAQVSCLTGGDPPDGSEEVRSHLRNRGYLHAGRAVVDSCEILVAVWNGKRSSGSGGDGRHRELCAAAATNGCLDSCRRARRAPRV